MSDAGLIEAAVMEILANDAALTALCPDGVFSGVAPPGSLAFVLVNLMDGSARPGLNDDTLYEQFDYWIRAVIMAPSKTPSRSAAARIQTLLHGARLDLTAAGYVAMDCRRTEPRAYPDVNPVNGQVWHHAGGRYAVMAYPINGAAAKARAA